MHFRGTILINGLAALAVFAVLQVPAYASLVPSHLDISGDGLVTRDTVTGLEWLDLRVTQGFSVNEIITGANGRNFLGEGWRYATVDEVHQLLGDAGVSVQAGSLPLGHTVYYVNSNDGAQIDAIRNLQSLISITSQDWASRSWGWTTPFTPAPWRPSPQPSSVAINCCQNFFGRLDQAGVLVLNNSDAVTNSGYTVDSRSNQFGSFLVRDLNSVPEPPALALVGIALFGFVVAKRQKN